MNIPLRDDAVKGSFDLEIALDLCDRLQRLFAGVCAVLGSSDTGTVSLCCFLGNLEIVP